jgi:beta-lactam-binding protein with PASTA domain
MKAFFRFALLAMILLLVAMASALTAMRIAIHGREVVIPKLVGLTPGEAERVALQNGVLIDIENRFYSADVPDGRILSQSPQPGTEVRRGWRVRLAESLGPQRVVIPDVVGQSSRAAEINLRRRGLELGTIAIAHLGQQPLDQVIAQTPAPNAEVSSPKVDLLYAAPPDEPAYVLPSFVGRPLAEAVRIITDAGLKLGTVHTLSNGTAPTSGVTVVVRQSPAAGTKVSAGTKVDLEASR